MVLSYSMLCMCLIYGLPVITTRPTDGVQEARGALLDVDIETPEINSSIPVPLEDMSAEMESGCEPHSQVIEELVEKNMEFDNILYPFSAMAETVYSKQKRQSGESAVVHDDVCRKIAHMANVNLPTLTETPCPWNYTCTYHPDIYPHYILQARCSSTDCTYPCSQGSETLETCATYSTTYTVLQLPENGCGGTNFKTMTVTIGCTCKAS